MSAPGEVPWSASAAASSIDAPPASASSVAVARTTAPAMLASATRPSTAAAATIGQSFSRRGGFSRPPPAPPAPRPGPRVVLRAGELLVAPAGRAGPRHPQLDDQLVGLQRGLEEAQPELGHRDRPAAVRALDDDVAAEREQRRGQVRRRVAVRDRAAERALV